MKSAWRKWNRHVTAITHREDAVYPAAIVGIPPMEDFCIGGASVKLFLPIFTMNFPEIVDIALPAEGVFHNLVFVSIKKTYPMQAYKIMHGLWGMGQMMFTKYIVVVDADVGTHGEVRGWSGRVAIPRSESADRIGDDRLDIAAADKRLAHRAEP